MNAKQALLIIDAYMETAWLKEDWSIIDDLFSDDFWVSSPMGVRYAGKSAREYLRKVNHNWFNAFSQSKCTWRSKVINHPPEKEAALEVFIHWRSILIHRRSYFRQLKNEQVEYPATHKVFGVQGTIRFLFNRAEEIIRYDCQLDQLADFYKKISTPR